jgi:hypothetical protein
VNGVQPREVKTGCSSRGAACCRGRLSARTRGCPEGAFRPPCEALAFGGRADSHDRTSPLASGLRLATPFHPCRSERHVRPSFCRDAIRRRLATPPPKARSPGPNTPNPCPSHPEPARLAPRHAQILPARAAGGSLFGGRTDSQDRMDLIHHAARMVNEGLRRLSGAPPRRSPQLSPPRPLSFRSRGSGRGAPAVQRSTRVP